MAPMTASFASHARSNSLAANNLPAHRRAGVTGPAQHASPSSNVAFPRLSTHVAFPGTATAPRSIAAPNTATAPPRSLQHLSLLTTRTPTSIAKLAFPQDTLIAWFRLQSKTDQDVAASANEHHPQDQAPSAAAASTSSSRQPARAWDARVQRVLSCAYKSRSQSLPTPHDSDRLPRVIKDPLIYASSKYSSSSAALHTSKHELWVFVAITDDQDLKDQAVSAGASEASENRAGHSVVGQEATKLAPQQLVSDTDLSQLDTVLARHLSVDLAKSILRLATAADVSSGVYRLSAAASNSSDSKGKQSLLTSQQRQAHKRFMASLRDRVTDSFAFTPSPPAKQGRAEARRVRLRFGDNVVFLPSQQPDSRSSATTDAAWFAGAAQPKASLGSITDPCCLMIRLDVAHNGKSLYVNATSRRLAALPLINTRYANCSASLPPDSPRPTLLISPLGSLVELMGVVPTTSIATEHLSELSSAFAAFDPAAQTRARENEALFASGIAICAFPRPSSEAQSPQHHPPVQDQQHPEPVSFVSSSQGETRGRELALSAATAAIANGSARSERMPFQFLWPAAWCLVLQDRAYTSSGSKAINDLQSMQSQPMTPLKELVSFTLKVLNDANDSALAQSTAPYTPAETDNASLARQRADRLASTRADITPASLSFADFDFAMPTAGSGTSSANVPAAGQSVPATSPFKRETTTSAEHVQAANNAEAFDQDLNWMQFLPPQTSDEPATSSASAFAMQVDATNVPTSASDATQAPRATTGGMNAAKQLQIDQTGPNWLVPSSATLSHQGAAANAISQSSSFSAPQSLLQPHAHTQIQGSTPPQGLDSTSLGFTQPSSTKRKAGEGDIFGNLGLLTEDDFSFFDESAFGLDAEPALPQHVDQPTQPMQIARPLDMTFGQDSTAPSMPRAADSQPNTTTAPVMDDVAMDDVGQNSLDALFSAIPGLQDAMASSEPPRVHNTSLQPLASSAAVAQPIASRPGHRAAQDVVTSTTASMHPFHSAMSSFTPRDASGATPFGDPASLPGFTPGSRTESSPAFGNPHYKTPRTPYSPVEEYRDGATIIDLHNNHRMGDAVQAYRDRHAASAPDLQATDQHPLSGHKADALLQDDQQLRLADASTAAAAAANAAMNTDGSSRKRPAIVPNAFLPLKQPEARKPLQRLPAGARANLGRKYDLLGKFASRPKPATATATTATSSLNATNAPTTMEHVSLGDAGKAADRLDKQSDSNAGRLASQSVASPFGPSPSKTPSARGQALLQLRRDRRGKPSPGSALTTAGRSSSARMVEGPMTPRSSEDVVMSGAISASDSDSSSSGDDDSDDASSGSEASVLTLSPQEQVTLKDGSLDVIASYLCGAAHVSRMHRATDSSTGADSTGENVVLPMPHLPLSRALPLVSTPSAAAASSPRPTVRRWMLSRTAEWLVQNPQFRSMYGVRGVSSVSGTEIAIGDKIEVLEAMACALSLAPVSSPPKDTADMDTQSATTDCEAALPTLKSLVQASKDAAGSVTASEGVGVAEVLEPTRIAVGCQGSVVEALPSSLMLWDKSKLSAVSGQKHVVAKVLLTDASSAWHDEIVAWLERLRVTFETHGLGTHTGDAQSILAVADGSESLALSSCLDQLCKDGETWLDTLRSISSRVELELLQGKHVVVYTLQPPNSAACASTGFHGLLRLEADLRAMLSEQVGVLAEQLLVRAVSPSMMTESGSLGFGQQSQTLRRLAFSVYDQLPRLVRRQPAKVLHGREAGPISAVVQLPAFSLSSVSDARPAGRTKWSLRWPQEPAAALDENVLLHVSYKVCHSGSPEQAGQVRGKRADSNASLDTVGMFGLGGLADGEQGASGSTTTRGQESIVVVSAIDERGGSSTVNALAANNGDSSIEACVERVWRFALEEASRGRVRWRLAISSAGVVSVRELEAWQRLVGSYVASTDANEAVMGSIVLLSVRPDESGAVLAERGGRTKPSEEWTWTTDKSSLVLLDVADLSQMVKFDEGMPMGWTQAFCESNHTVVEQQDDGEDQGYDKDTLALPIASAMLVHGSRPGLLNSHGGGMSRVDASTSPSQVVAVDMLQHFSWTDMQTERETEQEEAMDAMLRSLHRLRLISEERHQLAWPYSGQPWNVASVNTLAACLDGVALSD